MKYGLFVALDGPDGTGKTKLITELNERLKSNGYKVIITKEPSYGSIGTLIRQNNFKGMILAELVAADRLSHIENEIMPNLQKGCIVISDRYISSSYVCQQLDGISLDVIKVLNPDIVIPDLNIFLTANLDIVKKRLTERPELARMEKDFSFQKTGSLYKEAIEVYKKDNFKNVMELENNNEEDFENNVKVIIDLIKSLVEKQR